MTMIRQGDVLLVPADEQATEGWQPVAPEGGRVVLALGEDSGHAHALAEAEVTLWQRQGSPERLLIVARPTTMQHEEHAAVLVAPGTYFVHLQGHYLSGVREGRGSARFRRGD